MPGLKFSGDTGGVITRNHGDKLNIKGGVTTALSNNNIGVVADGSNTLTVKLAKDLTGLDSANIGGITLSSTGIDANSTQITNVASGVGNNNNAANIGDLNTAVAANKTKYYSVNSTGGSNDDNLGATGVNAMAMGRNASATGGQGIAIGSGGSGQHTTASGEQSIAIGANTVSKGASSIAIGGDDLDAASKANIDGTSASGINGGDVNATFFSYTGRDLVESPPYMVNTESGGAASIAMGAKALSKGALSTAIGVQSSSAGVASSAFGMGSSASLNGSVALGAGSTTATSATTESTMTVGGVTHNIAGPAMRAGDQISVGSAGAERQIKHVAGGAVNATSTDAVNGSQLHATNTEVTNNSTAIGLGLNFDGDTGTTVNRALGQALNIKGGATTALSNNNIGVVADGSNTLTVKLAKDLTGLDSANIGGITLSSTGIDANSTQITNVNDGQGDTDAVNVRQLNVVTETANRGWDISAQGNSTTASTVGPGDSVDFNSKNSNITVSKDTTSNDVSFELSNNLDLGNNGSVEMGSSSPFGLGDTTTLDRSGLTTGNSYFSTTVDGSGVRTGNSVVNTTVSSLGVAVSNPFSTTVLTGNGLNIFGGPSVTTAGVNGGNKRIVNVDDGIQAKDAVNVSQLNIASAAAKTEVAAGTNVASVVKSTGGNGQDVYTVNADGVTASAGSTAVTVTASDKDEVTNTTDYAVDLSETSKASLVKADSAMQAIVAQIDGADVKTLNQTDNTANFLTGDNIVLSAEDGGIKIATAEDVTFTSVSFADSTVRLSSEGLDNGGNRIINVDDGQGDTDAVNVRQLNATNNTVDLGLNFTGDDTAVVVNRKLSQTLTLQGGATELTENNIGVVADEDGNLNVRLAEDVMLGKNGSVRMESTVLNNAGVTITDGPNQTITLSNEGLDNGNNRIIKVGEGIAPTDAVNFAQLTTTNNEIAKGIKIGDGNSANDQQFALGDTINITGDSNLTTVASATGVQVKLNNQLDLGDDGSIQIGNSIMSDAGFTFVGNGLNRMVSQVSLSSRGLDNGGNTIRNIGEGVLNTDAVNVGQLKEVAIALDQGWGITAQGDIATMVKQGGAVDLSSKDGNIKVSRKLVGDVVALDGSPSLQAAAIPTNANDISFDLNPDITLNSVTTGDTVMNDNGLTIAGGPSITKSGIDAANTKITNVQNGEVSATSQDAINGGQLYAQGTGISSIIGGDTVYNAESGTFTNSDIGGTGESNIDGAIASIRQGTIEINENVQVNTESITTNTTNIANNTTNIATNTSNITTNTTNIKTNTDKLDAGLNFGADSGASINKPIGDDSILSFTGGNNITTAAEGSSIKFDLNGNISVDSVTVGTTVINNEGISMQDGPSMTSQGLYAGNQRITGVADGVEATDAVNYSQLSALDSRLNSNMSDLGYKIDEVEDDANAGISAAMAMSAMPQAYIAGKSLIGGGVGTYNGESAVAIGFSKLSNDGRWVIKVNGTADTQGNVGGAVGAGFHFD
uniref:YadA-like family protein n=1 Tax=Psychrobacter proteolyticus TaxID=147825 RepID=UPI000E0BD912|nr:YadA-like family protein [Psychrobacter proteolyticus]